MFFQTNDTLKLKGIISVNSVNVQPNQPSILQYSHIKKPMIRKYNHMKGICISQNCFQALR